jgi:hypothetical protein
MLWIHGEDLAHSQLTKDRLYLARLRPTFCNDVDRVAPIGVVFFSYTVVASREPRCGLLSESSWSLK